MAILETIEELAKKLTGGAKLPAGDVEHAYDQMASTVPQSRLAEGLTHAFKADETPEFSEMVTGLFNKSNPEQKAGFLNQILGALGPGGVTQALGAVGGLGALSGILSSGRVTPDQAQQVTPQALQALAAHAEKKDPSIIDAAASFYARNPALVKTIGAGALALLVSKLSQRKA